MATPAKKREIQNNSKENHDVDSSDSANDEIEENIHDETGTKIMVNFVGRNPDDSDYHGIKILLQQLFLKAHMNVGALAEHIISRNYVASVVKQGFDDKEDANDNSDDDDEDDEDDINDVFGITSIINISHGQNEECIQQLRTLLRDLASDYATDSVNETIKNILENDSTALGLIVNERFVNIPADISVPLLENLISDMKRATAKKIPYDFQYYILIAKLYKPKPSTKKNKKMGTEQAELFWSNQEEEVFCDNAMCTFEFSVDKESDTGLSGTWTEDDDEMIPYRRVILFEASKFPSMIDSIKKLMIH